MKDLSYLNLGFPFRHLPIMHAASTWAALITSWDLGARKADVSMKLTLLAISRVAKTFVCDPGVSYFLQHPYNWAG